jgi:three-Cys-motif partner protein
VSDVNKFFEQKHPWSKYKDLILGYYLKPYLAKVATLSRPIVVVDCFAGAGRFDDGELGSPLLIAEQLKPLYGRGVSVHAIFIEAQKDIAERLKKNTEFCGVPHTVYEGDFRVYVEAITRLASTHTVFLYVDPILPGDLHFADLQSVYGQLKRGQSIETLVNFLSTGFVRRAQGILGRMSRLDPLHSEVLACDQIAGGTYWQPYVADLGLAQKDRIDLIATGYAKRLEQWFDWVLTYPIREQYEDEQPKYHLIHGTRHPDAVDLMNRAMVKARREFVGARFVEGQLFNNQPAEEVVDPIKLQAIVLTTARLLGRTQWFLLRVHTTLSDPCMYTDSEINAGIKQLILSGKLGSSASGRKVEDDAWVWPTR